MNETRRKTKDPTTAKFVTIFDPHLSPNNPPSYKTDYWPIAKAAVQSVIRFGKAQNIDAFLWAGDIFHLKTAARNPTWFLEEVISLFDEAGDIPHLGIAGNHDIKFGNIQEGLKGQPLSLLITSGRYRLLDEEEWLFEAQDHTTRITGGSYHHAQASHIREKKKNGADHLIALGHFWFGPQSGEYFGEPIYGPDYLHASEIDIYLIGHHHEDQGIQTIGGKHYDSHGSLSRTGAHKNDLTRKPSASYWTLTKTEREGKVLRAKYPSADDTIDLAKREQLKEEKEKMDQFLAELNTAKLTAQDPKALLEELNPTTETKRKVLEYLDQAEAELG